MADDVIIFPTSRKMHVTRIAGTDASGKIIPEIWVDVLRVEEIIFKTQDALHFQWPPARTNQYQKVTLRLKWGDENGQDESNENDPLNASRTVKVIKVCAPDEDLSNPSEWVPLPVIKKFDLSGSEGNVKTIRRFLAEALNSKRTVENRRYVHHDTTIDDDAKSAFDSGQYTYRVPTDDYQYTDKSDDTDDYIEVEVPTQVDGRSTHHWLESNGDDLTTFWRFKNEFLIDASESALLETIGNDGFNPPYRTDPFQAIINASLSGLAVEYNLRDGRDRSWIVGQGNADMRKAVVSLWFRIPAATRAKAAANGTGDINVTATGIEAGVIPLIVFGPQYDNTIYEFANPTLHFESEPGPPPESDITEVDWGLGYVSGSTIQKSPPSYIGVNCRDGNFALEVNIQTPNKPKCKSTFAETTSVSVGFDLDNLTGTFPSYTLSQAANDASYVTEGVYENFGNYTFSDNTEIHDAAELPATDQWHHLLLSWDVTRGCSTIGTGTANSDFGHQASYVEVASKMWCAIDDVNLNKNKLPARWTYYVEGEGIDPNSILSTICQQFAGAAELGADHYHRTGPPDIQQDSDYDFGNPTAVVVPSYIPLSPCYVPAPRELGVVSFPYDIEMAEVQIWSGVSMDTSDIPSRRLFIDNNGKPVLVYKDVDNFLGAPVVRLHGNGLKSGVNSGTLPDFEPSGEIKKYVPGPSLNGKQSPE